MAVGKSGENVIANKIQVKIGNHLVAEQNMVSKDYKEEEIKEYMKWGSIEIKIDLGLGSASFSVYTCDFTKEYVEINADYRN